MAPCISALTENLSISVKMVWSEVKFAVCLVEHTPVADLLNTCKLQLDTHTRGNFVVITYNS